MTTVDQARDAICGMIRTGLLANPATAGLVPSTRWDDVDGDRPGHDARGLPIDWLRVTVVHFTAETETIGRGMGLGKEQHTGQVVVQVFSKPGHRGDTVAQAVKRIMQRQRITGIDGWFTGVRAVEIGTSGSWSETQVIAPFRYTETVE